MAVLELTYKPGTDDLREATSLKNVPMLLEIGAEVLSMILLIWIILGVKYPEGKHNIGSICYAENKKEALEDASVCLYILSGLRSRW